MFSIVSLFGVSNFDFPFAVIKDPPYVVKEAGYAAFEMPVTIYFKGKPEDPKKLEFKYDLDLQPFKVQKEEYVFHNPSEDFRRRLLKGGGVAMGKDPLMTSSKTSNSSDSVKKHKHKDEPKVTNTFKTLFGTPITKSSTKVSPDPKSQQMQQQQQQQNKISPNSVKSSKAEKPEKVSSSSSSNKEKSEKSEKHKSKHHSPSRERASDSKDSRRDKDDSSRHEKKKDKSHSKEKSSSKSKTKDKARSPSPKRPSSPPPVVKPKPVEPPVATPSDKSSTSSSKKSSKKDKKSSDRDKAKSKEGTDKKSDHTKGAKEKDVMATTTNNSTKDVLKEKPKHENKIEHSNPATPINDKRSEKGDSERKHKHKKKEKSKDHDRDKDVPKEKKASAKNSNKQQKEESNHTAPSPAKQQKRPESRKQQQQQQQHQQHNENTHSQAAAPKMSSRPPVNHETSDSDADSHALSSKIDSDNSLDRRSIKREDSSPSPPPPPPPAPAPDARPSKREKPVKDEKKRKRRSKNESDHSPSPSLMEPPQQKLRKEDIKNGETTPIGSFANANAATPNSNYDNVSSKSFISPSATTTTTTTSDRTNDYMTELKDLQHKIMTLQDNNDLQQVVEMIAATGQYEITSKTFDFDLCTLEPGLIKRLQEFFGATSCS